MSRIRVLLLDSNLVVDVPAIGLVSRSGQPRPPDRILVPRPSHPFPPCASDPSDLGPPAAVYRLVPRTGFTLLPHYTPDL